MTGDPATQEWRQALEQDHRCAWRKYAEDSRPWQVADRDAGPCAACSQPIVRGQAFQPLADAKGFFTHIYCEIEGTTT